MLTLGYTWLYCCTFLCLSLNRWQNTGSQMMSFLNRLIYLPICYNRLVRLSVGVFWLCHKRLLATVLLNTSYHIHSFLLFILGRELNWCRKQAKSYGLTCKYHNSLFQNNKKIARLHKIKQVGLRAKKTRFKACPIKCTTNVYDK